MTAQLPSKVRLAQIASFSKSMALLPSHDEIEAMASALLAAHEQEPVPNYIGSKNALEAIVAFIKSSSNPTLSDYNIVSERLFADNCQSLSSHVIEYITHIGEALEDLRQDATHHAPVPAVSMPADLHPDTQKLVSDFSAALAEKLYKAQLKYGYDADWKQDGWPTQCQAHFHQHIAKGDPRDVAAYCAFMWYHGWKTESQAPVPAVPDEQALSDLRERLVDVVGVRFSNDDDVLAIFNACRAAMLNGGKS